MSEPSDEPSTELQIPDKKHFKIGEVAEILNVKKYVLRHWESEFPMVSPRKTSGRHRMYTREDIELLATIKSLLYDQMFTIAGARKRLQEIAQDQGSPMANLFADLAPDGGTMAGALDGTGHVAFEQEMEQLRAANRALRGQLEEAETNVEAVSTALHDVQMAHNESLAHVASLEAELRQVPQRDPALEHELRDDNQRLSAQLRTLEAEKEALEAERDALREALAAERKALRKARAATAAPSTPPSTSSPAQTQPSSTQAVLFHDLQQARQAQDDLRHELKDQLIHHRLFLKRLRNALVSLAEQTQ
ncbi:MAG: MerR family transcriptional regulator [Myxococcota bacterium]